MSAKDRKTLVVGAISVGSVVALGKGVPWWREWDSEQRARASIVLARAAEFDRAMTALPVTMDSAKNATHRYSAATNALLVEDTPTIASAKLTQLVAGVADDAGVKTTSLQVRPDSAFRDRFARVAVRVTGTGDIHALVAVLDALDEQDTLLSVRELSVTPAEPTAPDTKAEALRFQLLVEALALKAPPKALTQRATK